MKTVTTYLIENTNDKSVFNYYQTLASAKKDLEVIGKNWRILVLKGQRYGEGYHSYQVTYFGGVFLKQGPNDKPAWEILYPADFDEDKPPFDENNSLDIYINLK
jgi:hypothetical protein